MAKMGRDGISICRTCKTWQNNGYGSYYSWLDSFLTLEAFDAEVAEEPNLGVYEKNMNVRHWLVEHAGHDIDWTSGDCWYHDDDFKVLDGLTKVKAPYTGGGLG